MSPRITRITSALLATLAALPAAGQQVLLRDDFDGPGLDTSTWFVPSGNGTFFGRTQIRPPSETLPVAGGVIRLLLDTHNPTAQVPGDSFWGSEIDSHQVFELGSGLSVKARSRLVPPVPGGVVGSVFTFGLLPGGLARDEIDFELLGNDAVAGQPRVLTNVFDDDDFSQAGDKAFAMLAGLDLTAFHDYELRWFADRIQFFVDGVLVREEFDTLPDDPMNVRLNFWAPDMFFAEAYDPTLQPTASARANQRYFYEVDYVEVRRLGVAAPLWSLGHFWVVLGVCAFLGALLLRRPAHAA